MPTNVLWQPTDKQSEFLSADEDEVLYGGAAGGGKSDAILIDALGLQQGAVLKPHYRGILFRRSFPELRELIDRSRTLYQGAIPGAVYHESVKEWRFPSGAKIEFGYLEHDKDRFRYQGRQFQYIGWDELTQWASSDPYDYLLSRLRTTDMDLKCYCRSTTNPGGIGHEWVKARWEIPDTGKATRIELDVEGRKIVRRFIPASLADNPHLTGTGYRERLLLLNDRERKALLEGRWDSVEIEGTIYGKEMADLATLDRFCTVPIEPTIPVNTFWDLGRNDTTAIWFHQRVGLENRFIDYYEKNGEGLAHYIRVLQERGYIYGEHYLPHDVEVTELTTDKSRKQTLEEGGVRPLVVVPRVSDLQDGIEVTRQALASGSCWFDRERCKEGLKALRSYRREWDDRTQTWRMKPLHDWASNGADAFRQFAQGYQVPIRRVSQRRSRASNWKTA